MLKISILILLYTAKKEQKDCGSYECVAYWTEIIGKIEISLKRNTVETKRENAANGNQNSEAKKRELAKIKEEDDVARKLLRAQAKEWLDR